jgi:hypothetical protein
LDRSSVDKVKLCLKGAVLALCLVLSWGRPRLLIGFFTCGIAFFHVYHLFWLGAVLILVKRMVPRLNAKITSGKIFGSHYTGSREKTPAGEEKLKSYVRKMNRGALKTAAYWLLVILGTGALYRVHLFGPVGLFMVVVFFIFMDQFCVSVWCPFEWIIGNKCCASCRINNWGYLMAFAPLVFLPSFWTLSIVALSIGVVLQWEYMFHAHPERFFELLNENLMCRNCKDRCAAAVSRFSH